jgi:hypothetical protein
MIESVGSLPNPTATRFWGVVFKGRIRDQTSLFFRKPLSDNVFSPGLSP